MRIVLSPVVLNTIILSLQVAALPRPQVADNTDTSVVSSGTSPGPGVAQPFPNAGQDSDPSDGSTASTASTPVTTSSGLPGGANNAAQGSSAGDGSAVSPPSKPAAASWRQRPNAANNASTATNATHIDPPSELTGQLLGMPKCGGFYYNPKWDTCNQATGKITSKATPHGKRRAKFATGRRIRRQSSESTESSSDQENDPSILNGHAGVDDGAVPGKHSAPPAMGGSSRRSVALPPISPFTGDLGKREGQAKTPGNINFWNTPFELPQGSGTEQSQSGKREAQEKTPGNTNFWNTPFEPSQESGTAQSQSGGKKRRQSPINSAVDVQNGPLKGEDMVLDGTRPVSPSSARKPKRQSEQSPNVEVGPPGPGGARNIIINKRQNNTAPAGSASASHSNDPTGYLGKTGDSVSGLNYESASVDPATPPARRAQPDFEYVPSKHVGEDIGPRYIIANRRQANNSSSNVNSNSNGPSGYLGALGAEQAAAAGNGVPVIPPGKKSVRDYASQAIGAMDAQREKPKSRRGKVQEDADGKLIVSQTKREAGDGAVAMPMPKRADRFARRDNMNQYKQEIPSHDWYRYWPFDDSDDESDEESWWGD